MIVLEGWHQVKMAVKPTWEVLKLTTFTASVAWPSDLPHWMHHSKALLKIAKEDRLRVKLLCPCIHKSKGLLPQVQISCTICLIRTETVDFLSLLCSSSLDIWRVSFYESVSLYIKQLQWQTFSQRLVLMAGKSGIKAPSEELCLKQS